MICTSVVRRSSQMQSARPHAPSLALCAGVALCRAPRELRHGARVLLLDDGALLQEGRSLLRRRHRLLDAVVQQRHAALTQGCSARASQSVVGARPLTSMSHSARSVPSSKDVGMTSSSACGMLRLLNALPLCVMPWAPLVSTLGECTMLALLDDAGVVPVPAEYDAVPPRST